MGYSREGGWKEELLTVKEKWERCGVVDAEQRKKVRNSEII